METKPIIAGLGQVSFILRGEPEPMNSCVEQWDVRRAAFQVAVVIAGTGLYGAAMGYWRDPRQALYTAVKFPLIILLTTLGNALLNGMLAPLLGLNLSFRQSLQAMLLSFMIAATILGSFSPLLLFLVCNVPVTSPSAIGSYAFVQLTQVEVIAFAGVVANLRLAQLLQRLSGSALVGRRVLFAWLAGNLVLGSQLSWILRPFIGSPGMPVEFLRKNAFDGNFYETVFRSFKQLLSS